MKNISTIKAILYAIVWTVMFSPLYALFTGWSTATGALFGWTTVGSQQTSPIMLFIVFNFMFLVTLILIFTPGRHISSPIAYLIDSCENKISIWMNFASYSQADKGTFSKRSEALLAALIDFLFLTVVVAIYVFLLVGMVNKNSPIQALLHLAFVMVTITFTSWITGMLRSNDEDHTKDPEKRMLHRYLFVFALIIGMPVLLWLSSSTGSKTETNIKAFECYRQNTPFCGKITHMFTDPLNIKSITTKQ